MAEAVLKCPSCGTDVSLSLDITCVTVCPSCLKVLERGDVGLVDRGVLAPLRETRTRLRVGLRGRYDLKFFTVMGRVQMMETSGNLWDEWYAAFDGGEWGWLAEDRGRIWLSTAVEDPGPLPEFLQIRAGDTVTLRGRKFTVTEVDTGQVVAAEGEIPFFFSPAEPLPFADLSGENAAFGTIDYTFDPPRVYLGRELPVESFRLDRDIDTRLEDEPPPVAPPPEPICPSCKNVLPLRTPGETVRLVCPHCATLSDLRERTLTAVRKVATQAPRGPAQFIPLGAQGTLAGERLTVVAWRLRSMTKAGVRYPWQEVVLYGDNGYRYLDCADGHLVLGRSVAAGDVKADHDWMRFQGRKFERFSSGDAICEALAGEWPWKVDPDERGFVSEYVCPPFLLSRETGGGEIDWTHYEHVPRDEFARAFPAARLPPPSGVGAAEPFRHTGVFRVWRWSMLAVAALFLVRCGLADEKVVLENGVTLSAAVAGQPMGQTTVKDLRGATPPQSFPPPEPGQPLVVTTETFELRGGRNVMVEAQANVDNSWVFAGAELLNVDDGTLQPFSLEISYYHGVDGGESWSEGADSTYTRVSAMPAGVTQMRLEIERDPADTRPLDLVLRVTEDSPNIVYLFIVMALGSLLPLFVWILKSSHERVRWDNSDFPKGSED